MKRFWWLIVLALAAMLSLGLTLGCDDDDDDDDDLGSGLLDDDDDDDDLFDSNCTIDDMCEAATECGGWSSVDECKEDIEEGISACADVDGWQTCSCACLNSSDCDTASECAAACSLQYCF